LGKHASPGYECARSAFNACVQSFEPGDALVAHEFSVADRFDKQVSL
jgi:hypothetical protein